MEIARADAILRRNLTLRVFAALVLVGVSAAAWPQDLLDVPDNGPAEAADTQPAIRTTALPPRTVDDII